MIYVNTAEDIERLEMIFDLLKKKADEYDVDLSWQEIKGTIYFFPQLPAKG